MIPQPGTNRQSLRLHEFNLSNYLQHHKNDAAGAQRIAATYCVDNYDECAEDALVWDATIKMYNDLANALAFVVAPEFAEVSELDSLAAAANKGEGETSLVCSVQSFSPDTNVLMADGSQEPVSEINTGDAVAAADPATGKNEGARSVTATHVHLDSNLIEIKIQTSPHGVATIHTTSEHPFWDDTAHAWVQAAALIPGHTLVTATGARVTVSQVHHLVSPARDMYNLTVQGLHTYYVLAGATPVLVHNCPAGSPSSDPVRSEHGSTNPADVPELPDPDGGYVRPQRPATPEGTTRREAQGVGDASSERARTVGRSVSNPEDVAHRMNDVVHTPDGLTGATMTVGMVIARSWQLIRNGMRRGAS